MRNLDDASAAVTEMGGRVAKKLGDGLMALFGYPLAHGLILRRGRASPIPSRLIGAARLDQDDPGGLDRSFQPGRQAACGSQEAAGMPTLRRPCSAVLSRQIARLHHWCCSARSERRIAGSHDSPMQTLGLVSVAPLLGIEPCRNAGRITARSPPSNSSTGEMSST